MFYMKIETVRMPLQFGEFTQTIQTVGKGFVEWFSIIFTLAVRFDMTKSQLFNEINKFLVVYITVIFTSIPRRRALIVGSLALQNLILLSYTQIWIFFG